MEQIITLQRFHKGANDTVGRITMPSGFHYYTLEPTYRGDNMPHDKIKGRTAIPQGTYPVVSYPSAKHRCMVPLLKNVPGFDMIEIHVGNTYKDSEGCILIGKACQVNDEEDSQAINRVLYSKVAYSDFYREFAKLEKAGTVKIKIENL